jgi:cellulose synthase/poly-beta-1,6-N-acetylglucosamine synthase-like glycosyltransferase
MSNSLWKTIKIASYYKNNHEEWLKTIPALASLPASHPSRIDGGMRTCGRFHKTSKPGLPLVSIITIVYNGARYLEKTIQSVLNQTYDNIEYIIIDGGSTDGTLDIIRKYEDQIAYWMSEPDKGISDAFNKGIQVSSGEIIGIINADDWYVHDAVNLSVRKLAERSTFGFSFGGLAIYYGDTLSHSMRCDAQYAKIIRYNIPAINHPTFFVRRTVYETCGLFSINLKFSMDYELFLRMHKNNIKGICLEKNITCMRMEGISDNTFIGSLREVLQCSVLYGQPEIIALVLYAIRVFKGLIRRSMQKVGMGPLVHEMRKLLERNYREA